jgi:hypothetical protein
VNYQLNDEAVHEVMSVLSARYAIDLCDANIRLITAPLGGKAVCAVQWHQGVLCVVVDVEKPMAHSHAREMLRQWQGLVEAPPLNEVSLAPVRPEPEDDTPVRLSLVS